MSAQPNASWQSQSPPVASFRAAQARTLKANHQQVQHALNRILHRLGVPDKAARAILGIHGMLNGRDKFPVFCAHKWAARQLNFKGQDENADQFMQRTIGAIREAERACGRRFFKITPGGTTEQLMTSYDADHIGGVAVWLLLRAKYGDDELRAECSEAWKKNPAAAYTDELIDEAISRLPECPVPPKSGTDSDGPSITDSWVIKGVWTKLESTALAQVDRILESGSDPRIEVKKFCDALTLYAEREFNKRCREAERARRRQAWQEYEPEGDEAGQGGVVNTYPTNSCPPPPPPPASELPEQAIPDPPGEAEAGGDTPRQADGGVGEPTEENKGFLASLLEAALAYAKSGWLVIPNHTPDAEGRCSCRKPGCKSTGKHPRTLNGVKGATRDEATIRRWWGMWPDANVGIATGLASGIVVLDVDPRHGGDVSVSALIEEHEEWPHTLEADTGGGGKHIVFQHPGIAFKNSASDLGEGLDIKTDGGQFIVAPSTHARGGVYKWTQLTKPAPMPEWTLAELTKERPRKYTTGQGSGPLNITADGPPILDGNRNDKLFKICCALRGRGAGPEQLVTAVHEINKARCKDKWGREPLPLDDDEVEGIVESAMRYEPNPMEESEAV